MPDLQENKTIMGNFWLFDTPEEKYNGTFTYSEKYGAVVEIVHSENLDSNLLNYALMTKGLYLYCELKGGLKLTLINGSKSGGSRSNGLSLLEYSFRQVIEGSHIKDLEEQIFSSALIKLDISNWIDTTGFDRKYYWDKVMSFEDQENYQINYKQPENVILFSNNKMTCELIFKSHFIMDGTIRGWNKNCKIEEYSFFELNFKNPINYSELNKLKISFLQFFWLLTNSDVKLLEFSAKMTNEWVIFPNPPQTINRDFDYVYSLVKHKDIEDRLGSMLEKWLEIQESDLVIVTDAYFSTISSSYTSSVFHFLNYCKILESYHRIKVTNKSIPDTKEIPEDTHARVKSAISSLLKTLDLDTRHIELYSSSLIRNEASFGIRLNDLFKSFGMPQFENYIRNNEKSIKDTRNYYTHLDPKSHSKALSGKKLSQTTLKLRCVIEMLILKELDIDNKYLQSMWVFSTDYTSYYQHLINYGHLKVL
jgi:ApeA N-terminal domain 1